MAQRRNRAKPHFTQSFWIPVGDQFKADPERLRETIFQGKMDNEQLRRRLGAAYSELGKAIRGEPLEKWTAAIIDWAVSSSGNQE